MLDYKTLKIECILMDVGEIPIKFCNELNYLSVPPDIFCEVIQYVITEINGVYFLRAGTKYDSRKTSSKTILEYLMTMFKLNHSFIYPLEYIFNVTVLKNNKIICEYTNDDKRKFFKQSTILTSEYGVLLKNELVPSGFSSSLLNNLSYYLIRLPEEFSGYPMCVKARTIKRSWLIETYVEIVLKDSSIATVKFSKNLDNYPFLKPMLSDFKDILIELIINSKI